MSSLQMTFEDIYKAVSDTLGLGTSPTDTNLTKCKDLVFRAYRQFLFPVDLRTGQMHEWSFLTQEATLTTQSGVWLYELPPDFGLLGRKFEFGANDAYPALRQRPVGQIMAMRNLSVSTSYPKYFAIRAGEYELETGQKYEVLFHEPPNGVYNFNYSYLIEPAKPTATTDVFVGGAFASECILECALALAERAEDEVAGIHTAEANRLTQQLISQDRQRESDSVGVVVDSNVRRTMSYRDWKIPNTQTNAYGYTNINE